MCLKPITLYYMHVHVRIFQLILSVLPLEMEESISVLNHSIRMSIASFCDNYLGILKMQLNKQVPAIFGQSQH